MKILKYIKLLALLVVTLSPVFIPATLLANAGYFDNSGAGLVLGNTDKIQMVSEVVEISFRPADGPVTGNLKYRDKAYYNCRFVLKNLSDQTVVAQVGFPLIGDNRRPDPSIYPDAKDFYLEHYGFTAQSGDTVYPVREQFNKDDKQYGHLLAWQMEFAPHATIELEVSYSIHGYNGVAGTTKRPLHNDTRYRKYYLRDMEEAVVQMYPYVTQTAGSWAGQVESAQFIIRDADFMDHLHKRGAFEKKADDKSPEKEIKRSRFIEEQRQKEKILRNGSLYRTISAGDWQADLEAKALRWTETPFTEHQDFEIWYIFSLLPNKVEGFNALLNRIESNHAYSRSYVLKALEKAQGLPESDPQRNESIERINSVLNELYPMPFGDTDRKNVADAVLEFYGITTGNRDISDFLEQQNWYPVKESRPIDPELKAELLRWHSIQ